MFNKTEYTNHSLWNSLDTLRTNLRTVQGMDRELQHFVGHMAVDLSKRKDRTNPFYIEKSTLDDLNNKVSNLVSWVPATSFDAGYRPNVINLVEYIYTVITTKWPAANGRIVADISENTGKAVVENTQNQLSTTQKSVEQIVAAKNRIEELEVEYASTLEVIQDNFKSAAQELISTYEEKFEAIIEDQKNKLTEIENRFEDQLQSTINSGRERLKATAHEADEILETVKARSTATSGLVIAESYAEYAQQQSVSGKRYDVIAIILAVFGVLLVGWTLASSELGTSASIYKLAVTIGAFTVSGLLFKRGTFKLKEAKAARRTELTLRQYDPFIATLDEEQRKEIIVQIADRIFIRGEIDDEHPSVELFKKDGISEKDAEIILKLLSSAERLAK